MNDAENTDGAFYAFHRAGVEYLALPLGRSVHILDRAGNNYGSFYSVKSFDEFRERGEATPLGKCEVQMFSLRAERTN